jgi:hypothetical protein
MAMISPEKALDLVAHLSDEQLRASVSDAFLHGRFLATGLRGEDQPEDLYIALLLTPRNTAVLQGCIDVFSTLAPALFAPTPILTEQQSDALYHLMALIGIVHPPALQGHTQGILQLVLKREIPKTIRNPVVRAALGYARTENDAKFWEPFIGENLIPGYAFKALLQIDPQARRIADHLVDLWQRKLRGELAIEVAPVTADASKACGGDEKLIADVIGRTYRITTPELRQKLIQELERYPWSKDWVKYATVPITRPRCKSMEIIPKASFGNEEPSHAFLYNFPSKVRLDWEKFSILEPSLSEMELIVYGRLPDFFPGKVSQGIQIFTPEKQVKRQKDVQEYIRIVSEALKTPTISPAKFVIPTSKYAYPS